MKTVTLRLLNETDDPKAFSSCTVGTIFRVLPYRHVIWNLDFRSYTLVSGWPYSMRVPKHVTRTSVARKDFNAI